MRDAKCQMLAGGLALSSPRGRGSNASGEGCRVCGWGENASAVAVRAMINGRPAWLGVDSGAPVSAIASHRREHFHLTGIPSSSKLPARLQINGGFNNVAIVHNFALGNLNLIDEPVVTVNLRSSTRAARLLEEQEIDGILGADILFPT